MLRRHRTGDRQQWPAALGTLAVVISQVPGADRDQSSALTGSHPSWKKRVVSPQMHSKKAVIGDTLQSEGSTCSCWTTSDVPKPQGFERGLDKHAVGNRLVNSPFLTALHPDSKAPWSLSQPGARRIARSDKAPGRDGPYALEGPGDWGDTTHLRSQRYRR